MVALVAGFIFAFSWVTLTVVHHNQKQDQQAVCQEAMDVAQKKAIEVKADYFDLPKECRYLVDEPKISDKK